MGRRAEILEAERSYDLVKREKPESGKFIKDLLRFLFSQVGLIFLGGFVAFLGKYLATTCYPHHSRFLNNAPLSLKARKPTSGWRRTPRRSDTRINDRPVEKSRLQLNIFRRPFGSTPQTRTATTSPTISTFIPAMIKKIGSQCLCFRFLNKVDEDLRIYTEFIVNSTRDYNYDGAIDGWDYFWTLPKALLFTITIMTTIGYGHIYPVTLIGQLFTIVYALVALPIFFVMMANVGNGLANGITYMYSRLCCRWFRAQRVKAEIPNRAMRKKLKRRLIKL